PVAKPPSWLRCRAARSRLRRRVGAIKMSEEEFRAWQHAFETYGVNGLHATALQQYCPQISVPASSSENSLRQSFDIAAQGSKWMTNCLSYRFRCLLTLLMVGVAISCQSYPPPEQAAVDIDAYFQQVLSTRGAGLARKTKPVDVRAAKPGE